MINRILQNFLSSILATLDTFPLWTISGFLVSQCRVSVQVAHNTEVVDMHARNEVSDLDNSLRIFNFVTTLISLAREEAVVLDLVLRILRGACGLGRGEVSRVHSE